MIRKYGLLGVIRLIISLLYTKIFYPRCRLIRLPFDIRNRKDIDLGNGLVTGFNCRIESEGGIVKIGDDSQINDNVHIASRHSITIGKNFLCASRVFITDLNHGSYSGLNCSSPSEMVSARPLYAKPVVIGNNVWLGENVIVLPGVTLGDNCIIGAGSVVTKSIPANSIAVGNPCLVVKMWNGEVGAWVNV